MKTSWTKGMNVREREEIISSFSASSLLRDRLKQLCSEKIEVCRKDATSSDGYANPNWAFKQADAIGYERALKEIISLISSNS